jgi:hypothetical protein
MSGVAQSARVESGIGNVTERAPELGSHVYALVAYGMSESQRVDRIGDNQKLVKAGILPEVSINLNKSTDKQSLLSDNTGDSAGKAGFSVEGIKSRYGELKSERREPLSEQQVAGVQGAEWAHRMTQLTNTEWGGLIYKNVDGGTSLTPPISDNLGGGVEPNNAKPLVPIWAQNGIVADYHSHPHSKFGDRPVLDFVAPSVTWSGTDFAFQNEGNSSIARPLGNPTGQHFSGDDIQAGQATQRTLYLGDPIGNVKEFVPPPAEPLTPIGQPLPQFSSDEWIRPSASSYQISDVLPWQGMERTMRSDSPKSSN